MTKHRAFLINFLVFCISTLIMFGVAEFIYRQLLFSNIKVFSGLRNPGFYSDYLNEDNYWKLYYMFGGDFKPPENPHPLLGWIGNFDRTTLKHEEREQAGLRRPVLLFGDSYAACIGNVSCFQDILNHDSLFSKDHFLLNYGVGGYGVDQIYLLLKNVVGMYDDPFYIFSLMNYDLDRTPMSFRIGQKPVFEIQNDSLILKNIPVNNNADLYLKENPPDISSYLYRRFLYSDLNLLGDSINKKLKKWDYYNDQKRILNDKILSSAVAELRNKRHDFMFVVFHYIVPGEDEFSVENTSNWRDVLMRDFLDQNDIPYIWSKDVIMKDPAYNGSNYDLYMQADNGHPTTYLNRLISDEIKQKVLRNERLRNGDVADLYADMIRNKEWLSQLELKALNMNKSLQDVMREDALFLLKEMINKKKVIPAKGYFKVLIYNDPEWLNTIKKKALRNATPLETQIDNEASYLYFQMKNEESSNTLSVNVH